MEPSFANYLGSWAGEFSSRALRVRQLIGGAHWLSDGSHKEALLIDFLSRHLPLSLHISRGFIRPPDEKRSCSPEVDVLVIDPAMHPPLFNEGGLIITPPRGVLAHVQSKSEFNAAELRKAIANQMATQFAIEAYVDSNQVWRGIVFAAAEPSRTCESLSKTIQETIQDFPRLLEAFPKGITTRPEMPAISLLPKCIATYDRFIAFLSKKPASHDVHLRVFEARELAFACFACDLFSFVCSRANPSGDDLHHIIRTHVNEQGYTATFPLQAPQ